MTDPNSSLPPASSGRPMLPVGPGHLSGMQGGVIPLPPGTAVTMRPGLEGPAMGSTRLPSFSSLSHQLLAASRGVIPPGSMHSSLSTPSQSPARPEFPGLSAPMLAGSPTYRQGGPNYFTAQQQHVGMISPVRKVAERTRSGAAQFKKQCNCKNSRCLKLYCECFASGRYCESCNCVNCFNNRDNESIRQSAVEAILERNPNAFRPKIQQTAEAEAIALANARLLADSQPARHTKGCNCKKSTCLKKYCECFQAGIFCSDNCKCIDCKNFEGSEARAQVLASSQEVQAAAPGGPSGPVTVSSPAKRPRGVPAGLPGSGAAQMAQGGQIMASGPGGQYQPVQPFSQSRNSVVEVVNEVVKQDTIEQLSRLLLLVADEERQKLETTAGKPSTVPLAADNEASIVEAAIDPTTAEAKANEGTREGQESTGAEASTSAKDTSEQKTPFATASELYIAQERVVLEEFYNILSRIIETAQRKANEHAGAVIETPSQMMVPGQLGTMPNYPAAQMALPRPVMLAGPAPLPLPPSQPYSLAHPSLPGLTVPPPRPIPVAASLGQRPPMAPPPMFPNPPNHLPGMMLPPGSSSRASYLQPPMPSPCPLPQPGMPNAAGYPPAVMVNEPHLHGLIHGPQGPSLTANGSVPPGPLAMPVSSAAAAAVHQGGEDGAVAVMGSSDEGPAAMEVEANTAGNAENGVSGSQGIADGFWSGMEGEGGMQVQGQESDTGVGKEGAGMVMREEQGGEVLLNGDEAMHMQVA